MVPLNGICTPFCYQHTSFSWLPIKKKHTMKDKARHRNSSWLALSPLKVARVFPDGCLQRRMRMRRIWMSPASVVAPSKCHRSRRYMAGMQSCIKAKTAALLLDISGKLTVKKLPLSFTIIILRNYCWGFTHADRYMRRLPLFCLRVRAKRRRVKRMMRKRRRVIGSKWEREREKEGWDDEQCSHFFMSWPFCLRVGLCAIQ